LSCPFPFKPEIVVHSCLKNKINALNQKNYITLHKFVGDGKFLILKHLPIKKSKKQTGGY
jgi:hypothetical protein